MEIIAAIIFIIGSLLLFRWNRKCVLPIAILYFITVIYLTFLIREPTPLYRYSFKPFSAARRAIEFGGGIVPGLLTGSVKIVSWKNLEGVTLNILLFIPFGYVMPSLRQKLDFWWKVIILAFCMSLLIEFLQLISRLGFADIDDIINNTLGAGIGYLIYRKLLTYVVNSKGNKGE